MKRIELITCVLLIIIYLGCEKSVSPKKYVFDTIENVSNSFFVFDESMTPIEESLDGSFKRTLDTLPLLLEEILNDFSIIEEFEIMNDDLLRIRLKDGDSFIDTTFNYVQTGSQIMIDNPDFDRLVEYDENADVFKICLYMLYAVPGHNAPSNQNQAYSANVSFCQERSFDNLLSEQIQSFSYAHSDSIAVYFTEMVYR